MTEPIGSFLAGDEEVTCPQCLGGGYYSECFDDMCHGEEECIHGDDSTCGECHGEGVIYGSPEPASATPSPSEPSET